MCFLYRAVKILLEAGADPNAQDEFSTPFKTAARQHKRVMEGICLFLCCLYENILIY